jgi:Flp pilus assembly pilin Flp
MARINLGWELVRRFGADSSGVTAIEYGLMTLIAVAIMLVIGQVSGAMIGMFQTLSTFFSR